MQLHAEVALLRRALHLAAPQALAAAAGPPLSGGLPGHTPAGVPPEPLAQAHAARLQAGLGAGTLAPDALVAEQQQPMPAVGASGTSNAGTLAANAGSVGGVEGIRAAEGLEGPASTKQPPEGRLSTEAEQAGPGDGFIVRVPNTQTPSSSPDLPMACDAVAAEAAPAQKQLLGSVLSLPAGLAPSGPCPDLDAGLHRPLRLHVSQRPRHAEPPAGQSGRTESGGSRNAMLLAPGSPEGATLAGAQTLSGVPEVGALASLPGGLPSLAEVLGAAQRLSRAHALPAALPSDASSLHELSCERALPAEPAALPPWAPFLRMPGDQQPGAAPLCDLGASPPAPPPSVRVLLAAIDEAVGGAVQAADSQESSDARRGTNAQQPTLLLPSPGTSLAGLSSAYEALVPTPLQASGLGSGYASPPGQGYHGAEAGCAPAVSVRTWALAAEACLAASAGAAVTASQAPHSVAAGISTLEAAPGSASA